MINIAEILDKCTKGTKLYSPIFGDVYLEKIRPHLAVIVKRNKDGKNLEEFLYDGRYTLNGECMLFPSKENRDWNTFQIPFKDGDVLAYDVSTHTTVFIHRNVPNDHTYTTSFYVGVTKNKNYCKFHVYHPQLSVALNENCLTRLATEEEKQNLFNTIKENGYKWNPETKTLEKLVEPKFKVGDQIVKKNSISNSFIVNSVSCEYYGLQLPDKSGVGVLNVNEQDEWEVLPQYFFNDGDIIAKDNFIVIFSHSKQSEVIPNERIVYYHCYLRGSSYLKARKDCGVGYISDFRFASESEKQKLFNAIKENGYKWNAETKTLEKLIEPKFKSGDKIVNKNNLKECWYVQGNIDSYCGSYHYNIVTKSKFANLYLKDQDDWELAPTPKFKVGDIVETKRNKLFDYKIIKITDTHYTLESIPGANTYDMFICEDENWKLVPNKFDISTLKAYDKVLVRDTNEQVWVADLFSHVFDRPLGGYTFACVGHYPNQCIPYEGNEHLLGTNNDCGEYYKNW